MKKQKQKNYTLFDKYKVIKIENFIANNFIKNFHYLDSYPTEIKNRKFGLYENEKLIGVCSFGACVSWRFTFNSINKISPNNFIELNRLVLLKKEKNLLSWFVSKCLKNLKEKIIVAYADTKYHSGYIYQALNFYYLGLTKKTKVKFLNSSYRHRDKQADYGESKFNNEKHRYIYFNGSKSFNKFCRKNLNYEILKYPKNKNYKSINYEFKNYEVQGLLI